MKKAEHPGCVFRGAVTDGVAEFPCNHPEREKKTATYEECSACPLRSNNIFDVADARSRNSVDVAVKGTEAKSETMLEYISRGVTGLTKAGVAATTGIGAADEETAKKRYDTCLACDKYKHWRCQECGCFISAKVRVADEKCPLGKW